MSLNRKVEYILKFLEYNLKFRKVMWSLLISNSSFVQKMAANKGTELIQNLNFGHESWLLIAIGQYILLVSELLIRQCHCMSDFHFLI